jgi:hypothetical protein
MTPDGWEHILDKFGFPVAVVVWMFWRDTKFLRLIADSLTEVKLLLTRIEIALGEKKETKFKREITL